MILNCKHNSTRAFLLLCILITAVTVFFTVPGFCEEKDDSKKVFITEPGSNSAGPGAPVSAPAVEKKCDTIVAAVASGKSKSAVKYFGNVVMIMPGLYNRLGEKGQALLDKKPKVIIGVPDNNTGDVKYYKGGGMKDDNVQRCLASAPFKEIFKEFAKGKARPALQEERDFFYSLISFEIKGQPVTVIEGKTLPGGLTPILLFYMNENKVFIMEYLVTKEQ